MLVRQREESAHGRRAGRPQGRKQPGDDAPEQLIRIQVHGRPCESRVAFVQEPGTQQPQTADGPLQELLNGRLGGRVSGQGVQVALDDGSGRFFVHGQGPKDQGAATAILRNFLSTPSVPLREENEKRALARPDHGEDQFPNRGDSS